MIKYIPTSFADSGFHPQLQRDACTSLSAAEVVLLGWDENRHGLKM